jgi:hypothetical protein
MHAVALCLKRLAVQRVEQLNKQASRYQRLQLYMSAVANAVVSHSSAAAT